MFISSMAYDKFEFAPLLQKGDTYLEFREI